MRQESECSYFQTASIKKREKGKEERRKGGSERERAEEREGGREAEKGNTD